MLALIDAALIDLQMAERLQSLTRAPAGSDIMRSAIAADVLNVLYAPPPAPVPLPTEQPESMSESEATHSDDAEHEIEPPVSNDADDAKPKRKGEKRK